MSNRLHNEISPYLLQHAGNPVHWQPWDEQALSSSKSLHKPIFLSIGYAACHWCHVMEKESFEDPEIADILNAGFIAIKVDREERPDLDHIYMNAVVAMNGSGGWPLNVFLTPDLEPIYGGTYFPPVTAHGLPAFREVLRSILNLWETNRPSVLEFASKLTAHLQNSSISQPDQASDKFSEIHSGALQMLVNSYDWRYGGWGKAPKFPQPMLIQFLLLQASRGTENSLETAVHALNAMSQGGMFDLVGGGFHRYSTDNQWLVPHFEKMLYDNAQLARVYLHAYLLTKDESLRKVCVQTLDFIENELSHPSGGFYSSLDADSEGEEGKYYLWSYNDLETLLSEKFNSFRSIFEISPEGNFDGKIILRKKSENQYVAENPVENEWSAGIESEIQKLANVRLNRPPPALDDKIVLGWNALALQAFAEAAFYLNNQRYLKIAQKNADFLLTQLIKEDTVYRIWRTGIVGSPAYLEDFSALILGLLSLHTADWQTKWVLKAIELSDRMTSLFKSDDGGFYDTSSQHQGLIYRPGDLTDNATPSGNAMAVLALLKLNQLDQDDRRETMILDAFWKVSDQMKRYPSASAYWLQALDFYLGPVQQIAVILENTTPETSPFYRILQDHYLPRSVTVASKELELSSSLQIELLENRHAINKKTTVFVCENFTCHLPTNNADKLNEILQ